MILLATRRIQVEMNKSEIASLVDAYVSLGGILSKALEKIDPDRVQGIKGRMHKLTIQADYFQYVARSLYQKLDAPPPEIIEKPPEEQKIDPATCNHVWDVEKGTCEKCGIEKIEWEAGYSARQEGSDDPSARVGPEEDG